MILTKATVKNLCFITPLDESIRSMSLNKGEVYYLHLDDQVVKRNEFEEVKEYTVYAELKRNYRMTPDRNILITDKKNNRNVTVRPIGKFDAIYVDAFFRLSEDEKFDIRDYPTKVNLKIDSKDDPYDNMKVYILLDKKLMHHMEVSCGEGEFDILYYRDENSNYIFFYKNGKLPSNKEEFEQRVMQSSVRCKYI